MFSFLTTSESLQASVSGVLGRRKPTAAIRVGARPDFNDRMPGPRAVRRRQERWRRQREMPTISFPANRGVPEAAIEPQRRPRRQDRGVLRLWRNGSVVRYQSSCNSRRVQCARGRRERSPGSCLSSRLMLSTLLARDGGMHGHGIRAMRRHRRLPGRRHAVAGVPWEPCGTDSKAGFRLQARVQLTDIADRLARPKIQSRRLGVDGQFTRRDAP